MWPLLPRPSFVCLLTILRIPQLCHCFGPLDKSPESFMIIADNCLDWNGSNSHHIQLLESSSCNNPKKIYCPGGYKNIVQKNTSTCLNKGHFKIERLAMWIFHAVIQDIDSSNISNCCTMWGAIKSIIFPLAQFIWRSGWNYLMIISNGQVARHVTPRRVKYLCDFTSSEQLWNSSWHPIDFLPL